MTCEYCGAEHDVRALCAPRRTMSRRRFFSLSVKALAVAAVAPSIIDAAQALVQPAVEIDRATFTFWRNQQVSDPALTARIFDSYRDALMEIYNKCSAGPRRDLASMPLGLSQIIEAER